MIRWNNTFFGKLFYKSKIAFFILVVLCVGQLFFIVKGIETVPFFNYGMFSEPFLPQPTYNTFFVEINDNEILLGETSNIHGGFIWTSLRTFYNLREHNFSDPIEATIDSRFSSESITRVLKDRLANPKSSQQEFETWLVSYFEKRLDQKVSSLVVKKNKYLYKRSEVELVDTEILITYGK